MKEAKQTVSGILSSLGLWIAGILLAGNIPAVADYLYFGGSELVIIYPPLVGVILVFAAYKCSSKGYKEFSYHFY